jgi:predicted nuclease of predicted toxin-antitoxin system
MQFLLSRRNRNSGFTVLDRAFTGQAILLTGDKDFGELVFGRGLRHFGVMLVRLDGFTAREKATIVAETIPAHEHHLELAFCVVTPKLVRIRHSPRQ